ncbi:hypothetical protein [Amycolatopsis sp. NPDC004378]
MRVSAAIAALAVLSTATTAGVTDMNPATANCYSQSDTPYLFNASTVRSSGQSTCGVQYTFVIEYRSTVNAEWQNVTTSLVPNGAGGLFAYSTPARTGYYRSSINHSGAATTYSPDVYLVA